MAHNTITIDGMTLTLIVERKRVKNINARLKDSTLSISAPLHISQETLSQTIVDLGRKLVRRAHARQINTEEAARALAQRVASRFPHPPEIEQVQFVTNQRARWGSYSLATHTIRLNAALRLMPPWVLEAVVAHELGHITHHDHSPAFWRLVRKVCPETDRARAFLAGVSWLGRRWEGLPPIERAMLSGAEGCDDAVPGV